MWKIGLYGLASFMETGIGIWIFGKMFSERKRMKWRQEGVKWVLYALIMLFTVTMCNAYLPDKNKREITQGLLMIYVFFMGIYFLCMLKGQRKAINGKMVKAVLFSGLVFLLAWQSWVSFISAYMVLLGNVVVPLYLFVFFECTFVQAYLWEFLYLTNLGLLKTIYMVYVGIFEKRLLKEFIYSPRIHEYNEIIYLFGVYLVIILFMNCFPMEKPLRKGFEHYKKMMLLIGAFEWYILARLVSLGPQGLDVEDLSVTLIIVICILLFFVILFARFFWKMVSFEKNILDVRNEAVERQYHELKEAYERYRCFVHDEKHKMCYLSECLANDDILAAKNFVKSCQESMEKQGNPNWTGISMLDFMINMKKRNMDSQGIDFLIDARLDEIPMEDADFVVLLGNLFDNAIEAAGKCEAGKRKIKLTVRNINEMFMLEMKNSSTSVPKVKRNRFVTDKAEKNRHGWGIQSVRGIVERYGGMLSFQYDESFFEVLLVINRCALAEEIE